MNIRPLADRIVVRRHEAAKTSKGGILLPERMREREKSQKAEVLAVGPGRKDRDGKRMPLEISIGDTVLFGSYAGNNVPDEEGDLLLILREDDVLGVIEAD